MSADQQPVNDPQVAAYEAWKKGEDMNPAQRVLVQKETQLRGESMRREWDAQGKIMNAGQESRGQNGDKNKWAGQLGNEQQKERALAKQVLMKDPKLAMAMNVMGDQMTDEVLGKLMGKNPLDRTVSNLAIQGLVPLLDIGQAAAAWGISFAVMIGGKILKTASLSWYVHLLAWAVMLLQVVYIGIIVFFIVAIIYIVENPLEAYKIFYGEIIKFILNEFGIPIPAFLL
ncbi:MAG: hypothetical protein COX77_01605 [Candidatus Komeilibacteria bacterium CG_4_10_14_0_2_um_filter_37_10]|uniref:Uncharacterized protein n=1 Tax=Candidatus Komeilibacteria bacterium CG_4_10_14_0_2_um_filter_37_10 TaxID=1974470 RepID=A0A2M7VFP8_9BACT|nr:MAG: hypothetical protein COX77_01605 [Candidatus Komeilibacteria bacterium CG_4_10_14_0_2_um_filter_37_10]